MQDENRKKRQKRYTLFLNSYDFLVSSQKHDKFQFR